MRSSGIFSPSAVLKRLVVERVQESQLHRLHGMAVSKMEHHPKPEHAPAATIAVSEWMQGFVIDVESPRAVDAGRFVGAFQERM